MIRTKVNRLTKDEELLIAAEMEKVSGDILKCLMRAKILPVVLKQVIKEISNSEFPISYIGFSRNPVSSKKDLLDYLENLASSPTDKLIDDLQINYLAAQKIAQIAMSFCDYKVKLVLSNLEDKLVSNRNKLIEANIKMVPFIVKRVCVMSRGAHDFEELEMLGYDAMLSATGRYDHRMNAAFFYFARVYIFRTIMTAGRNNEAVSIPINTFKADRQLMFKASRLEHQLGRPVTLYDLEEHFGIDGKEGDHIRSIMEKTKQMGYIETLDTVEVLDEVLENPYSAALMHAIEQKAKRVLTQKELDILDEEFFRGGFVPTVTEKQRQDMWRKIWNED